MGRRGTSAPPRRSFRQVGRHRGAHEPALPRCDRGQHERVTFSACIRWLTGLAVGLSCVAAVIVFGELSTGALLAVGGTGVLVAVVGLARRSGEAALPVGRRGLPWLGWLAAALAWEFLTLLDDDLLTVSDLADRVLV